MFKVGSLVMIKHGEHITGYNHNEKVTRTSECGLYFKITVCSYVRAFDEYILNVKDVYGYTYYSCIGSVFIQPAEGVLTLEELNRINKLNHA